jgi:uncharacterized protein YdeI (YjbR/CyaY-like superfamily)
MITDRGVAVPEDMAAALESDPAAMAAFAAMRSTRQREFVDWVGRSSHADTRAERLAELPRHVLADAATGQGP